MCEVLASGETFIYYYVLKKNPILLQLYNMIKLIETLVSSECAVNCKNKVSITHKLQLPQKKEKPFLIIVIKLRTSNECFF